MLTFKCTFYFPPFLFAGGEKPHLFSPLKIEKQERNNQRLHKYSIEYPTDLVQYILAEGQRILTMIKLLKINPIICLKDLKFVTYFMHPLGQGCQRGKVGLRPPLPTPSSKFLHPCPYSSPQRVFFPPSSIGSSGTLKIH